MPFIHIRSLPMPDSFDAETTVKNLCTDFAEASGVGLEHISVTWSKFESGHYAFAGLSADVQTKDGLPVLVTYLAPDFGHKQKVAEKLKIVGPLVAAAAGVDENKVFVHYQPAYSGAVFDNGQIVEW